MGISRLHFLITHVASQLIYKWLPEPQVEEISNGEEPLSLEKSDWMNLISDARRDYSEALPWLDVYCEKRDVDGGALAEAICSHLQGVRRGGAKTILICDPEYPPLLRMISDPPTGLTAIGDIKLLQKPAVSIVGSRKASGLAFKESFEAGKLFATEGYSVVSGGAYGCDASAHRGALSSTVRPASTIAVFAGGLSTLYPRGNFRLFADMRRDEALFVSERLWGYPCRAFDFPVRNRIISGISTHTLVMQAAKKSGAMITALKAVDQGRDIRVLRHPTNDVRAEGNKILQEQGAVDFKSAQELIGELTLL